MALMSDNNTNCIKSYRYEKVLINCGGSPDWVQRR